MHISGGVSEISRTLKILCATKVQMMMTSN
jgi:hypothetical protein